MNELDVLLCLFYAAEFGDAKNVVKTAKRLRAKLNHRINPRVFKNIIEAIDPVQMVMGTIDNFLAAPLEPVYDEEKHGVAQVNTDYVYVVLKVEDDDFNYVKQNELEILEQIAIQATVECELKHAMVNVKLFDKHGFSGKIHQFEIGE